MCLKASGTSNLLYIRLTKLSEPSSMQFKYAALAMDPTLAALLVFQGTKP